MKLELYIERHDGRCEYTSAHGTPTTPINDQGGILSGSPPFFPSKMSLGDTQINIHSLVLRRTTSVCSTLWYPFFQKRLTFDHIQYAPGTNLLSTLVPLYDIRSAHGPCVEVACVALFVCFRNSGGLPELILLKFYDYLLTIIDECHLVWAAPWSFGKVIFFLTRYPAFVDISLMLYCKVCLRLTIIRS